MSAWVGPREDPRRYRFAGDGEPVGGGGEGFVYRAWRAADGLSVAVKHLVSVTPADWTAQVGRIEIVGLVSHPRLGRHLDTFVGPHPFVDEVPSAEEFENYYSVMAWIEGEDLGDAVEGVTLPVAFGWVRDVAHAAAALHRQPTPSGLGIVHRDIKPSNVRVSTYDSRGNTGAGAVLIDFGIARPLAGATMTRHAGAPGWMPPEAFEDHRAVGARSDTWQVGGLAAWMLLRTPPGALVGADRRARLDEALRRHHVRGARALARHIDRALASRPADRPADLDRWGDTLVALVEADPRRRRRRTAVLGGAAVIAVLLAGIAARSRTTTDPPQAAPPGGSGASTASTVAPTPIGTVTLDAGATSPFDAGEAIPLTVTHAGSDVGPGRLVVEARTGGRPTPGVATVERTITRPSQQLTLSAPAGADGAPVVIDELVLRLLDPAGASLVEQRTPVRLQVAPAVGAPERCTVYDPATVAVEPVGSEARVTAAGTAGGSIELARLPSPADADHAATVAREADARCLLGVREGDVPLLYWRRRGRLLPQLPAAAARRYETCTDYDPDRLVTRDRMLFAGDVTISLFPSEQAVLQALNLARHYRKLCIVGRSDGVGAPDAARQTFSYWQ